MAVGASGAFTMKTCTIHGGLGLGRQGFRKRLEAENEAA